MKNETIMLISSLAATISAIAATVTTIMTYMLYRKRRQQKLYEKLDRILEIGIQYPYVENSNFISQWLDYRTSQDEKYLRYDMYCNLIFNYLAAVYDHYKGNKKSIEDFVDVKTWIRAHQLNWKNPVEPNENIDGYSNKFRDFINSYI
ncbi:hypothetical protein FQ707_04625 [Bacteroidaceae bacterium HV4-6-C5C]|nr:hypothetical protein FQ707_04625 [Bacteroidaceae bacterium HV4-6-C5C]